MQEKAAITLIQIENSFRRAPAGPPARQPLRRLGMLEFVLDCRHDGCSSVAMLHGVGADIRFRFFGLLILVSRRIWCGLRFNLVRSVIRLRGRLRPIDQLHFPPRHLS